MVADDEQHRSTSTPAPTPLNGPDPAANTLPLTTWEPDLARLIDLADGLLDDPPAAAETTHQALRLADDLADRVLLRLSRQLVKPSKTSQHMSQAASSKSRLLFNARSCPARIRSFSPANQFLSGNEKMIYASGRAGEHRVTAVDIPSLGFVIAPLSQSSDGKAPKERTLAQAGGFLCNEFLETQIDTSRGHLRSLHIPAKRGNRLSLMIARRDRLPDGKYAYSEMVARDVKMLTSSNMCGVVRSTGHLEMNGKPMGEFEIDYEVWRGSRIVEVHVRLSKLAPLSDLNPWRSAYIARMAWPTEAALLRTFSCGSRHPWPSGRAVSPLLIEIDEADYRTHILTGGLAFHRRTETRFLETVLAVQGESSAAHRLGIGVDLPHPLLAASEFVDRTYQLELAEEVLPTNPSGWLATADTRNVVLDCESPLVDAQGRLVGLRLFLTETDGKSTNAKIRLLREIESANRVDYLGGRIGKLTTEGDRLTIAMRSNEQVNVDVIWKR
jgi:alpha-mannosidase